jgi:DNA-binding NtrC family response regulator
MVSGMLIDFLGDHFQVTCCADAVCALREMERHRANVLLLDHRLPGGNSEAVAEQADRDGVPVVRMTGDPNAVAAFDHGSHHLIAKPFNLDNLLDVLVKAIGPSCLAVGSGG